MLIVFDLDVRWRPDRKKVNDWLQDTYLFGWKWFLPVSTTL